MRRDLVEGTEGRSRGRSASSPTRLDAAGSYSLTPNLCFQTPTSPLEGRGRRRSSSPGVTCVRCSILDRLRAWLNRILVRSVYRLASRERRQIGRRLFARVDRRDAPTLLGPSKIGTRRSRLPATQGQSIRRCSSSTTTSGSGDEAAGARRAVGRSGLGSTEQRRPCARNSAPMSGREAWRRATDDRPRRLRPRDGR
jgi:hypothetical protein